MKISSEPLSDVNDFRLLIDLPSLAMGLRFTTPWPVSLASLSFVSKLLPESKMLEVCQVVTWL